MHTNFSPLPSRNRRQTPRSFLVLMHSDRTLTMLALRRLQRWHIKHPSRIRRRHTLHQLNSPDAVSFPSLRRGVMISFLRDCFPQSWSQSTKLLNLVISSKISCKSTSLILFVRLGINVFASSALSQHKLAAPPGIVQRVPAPTDVVEVV